MRIGDLAKLTNTKVETIRYYEKEGILHPGRKEHGTFREYNMWDVLDLLECLKYRHMDFTIQEVKLITKDGNLNDILTLFSDKEKKLRDAANNKLLLSRQVKGLHDRINNAPLNVGNYWFKTDEERVGIVCTERFEKEYVEFDVTNDAVIQWTQVLHLTKTYIRFSLDEIQNNIDHNIWYHTLDMNSFRWLNLPKDDIVVFPQKLCLHTIIDLGEKFQLSNSMIKPIIEQIQQRDLEIDGDIMGELLLRFYEKEKWHRYVELMIPIKKG